MKTPAQHDLDWLAFQYVTGELASTDAAAFESRMFADLDACDAVIRAMQLCETADAAFSVRQPDPVLAKSAEPKPQVGLRRVPVSVSLIAAVCVIAVAFMISGLGNLFPSREQAADAELARLWTESNTEISIASVEDVDAMVTEAAHAGDLSVPDWMIAALAAQQADRESDDVLEN